MSQCPSATGSRNQEPATCSARLRTTPNALTRASLIPGFIESHAHVTDWAECEFLQFTCYHIKNIAELQDMIRENAKTKKAGEWVIGYGYNDSMVAEMRHLERADIDAACADHPVFVMHGSGHLAYSLKALI
ncbi:MAG: amidohydrolase family protein [Bilophila wadsworthia]